VKKQVRAPQGLGREFDWKGFCMSVALEHAKPVGYLRRFAYYPRGEVSDFVFERLVSLARHPCIEFFGYHYCNLGRCLGFDSEEQPALELRYKEFVIRDRCSTDILVPGKSEIYIAPALILHYIRCHRYLPPSRFVEAVLACPDPESPEYTSAIYDLYRSIASRGYLRRCISMLYWAIFCRLGFS
jgi:hypothetical protein